MQIADGLCNSGQLSTYSGKGGGGINETHRKKRSSETSTGKALHENYRWPDVAAAAARTRTVTQATRYSISCVRFQCAAMDTAMRYRQRKRKRSATPPTSCRSVDLGSPRSRARARARDSPRRRLANNCEIKSLVLLLFLCIHAALWSCWRYSSEG